MPGAPGCPLSGDGPPRQPQPVPAAAVDAAPDATGHGTRFRHPPARAPAENRARHAGRRIGSRRGPGMPSRPPGGQSAPQQLEAPILKLVVRVGCCLSPGGPVKGAWPPVEGSCLDSEACGLWFDGGCFVLGLVGRGLFADWAIAGPLPLRTLLDCARAPVPPRRSQPGVVCGVDRACRAGRIGPAAPAVDRPGLGCDGGAWADGVWASPRLLRDATTRSLATAMPRRSQLVAAPQVVYPCPPIGHRQVMVVVACRRPGPMGDGDPWDAGRPMCLQVSR